MCVTLALTFTDMGRNKPFTSLEDDKRSETARKWTSHSASLACCNYSPSAAQLPFYKLDQLLFHLGPLASGIVKTNCGAETSHRFQTIFA